MTQPLVHIPDANRFRSWLIAAMDALDVKEYPLAVRAGVPVNAVSKFVKGLQHDLRLDTASKIYKRCEREAGEKGVLLPKLDDFPAEAAE